VFTTSGAYPWSFVTQIFHSGQPSHSGDHKTFEVMTRYFQQITGIYLFQIMKNCNEQLYE